MKVSMDRYRFYTSDNKVIAVSTYAGKNVRGMAKCDSSEDTFSLEYGKELAMARCNEKISEKRLHRAQKRFAEAVDNYIEAKRFYEKMKSYLEDSEVEYANANKELEEILSKLN